MIYCIAFDEVAAHLVGLGFKEVARIERQVIFRSLSGALAVIREPNHDGHIPEMLVNDAFDAAELEPPAWNVFWCD